MFQTKLLLLILFVLRTENVRIGTHPLPYWLHKYETILYIVVYCKNISRINLDKIFLRTILSKKVDKRKCVLKVWSQILIFLNKIIFNVTYLKYLKYSNLSRK